jgi:membrane protein insertase Oxa1/YidC/SpoIIIJ
LSVLLILGIISAAQRTAVHPFRTVNINVFNDEFNLAKKPKSTTLTCKLTQNLSPFFPTSRPTVSLPRARLTASLSSAAQRILDNTSSFELGAVSNLPPDDIHKIGDFAEMGLGLSKWPSDYMLRLLEFCHVSSELPWWGSIVLLTLILRIAMFPIMLKTTRNMSVAPYLMEPQKELLEASKRARETNDMLEMRKVNNKIWALYREWGYSPTVNFFGLVQIPVFFGMFRALYRSSNLPVPGFQHGGTLWFTDLTAIDPYFLLPTISGLTTAVTIWVHRTLGG